MKYNTEQKEIVTLCRRYKKVKYEFDTIGAKPVVRLYIAPNWDRDDFVPYDGVEDWLKSHAEPKTGRGKGKANGKGRPKTPGRRIKRLISLSEEADARLDALAKRLGENRNKAVELAVQFAVVYMDKE